METTQKETLSSEISAICSAGSAKRLRFQGRAARARQQDKRSQILEWMQRFGSTDQSIIERLLGISRSAAYKTIQQLEATEKLIQCVPVDGCLAKIYILTAAGRAEAEVANGPHLEPDDYAWCYGWARAPIYPSKLPISHIQHDHLVQHIALDLIEHRQTLTEEARKAEFFVDSYGFGIDEIGYDYVPSRTIQKSGLPQVGIRTKVPDLVFGLDLSSGFPSALIAVEVQQMYQSEDDASADLSRYAQEMGNKQTWLFKVIYASTRPALLKYYQSKMTPQLGFWAPNAAGNGYYENTDRPSPATPKIIERFEFRDISHLHKIYYPGK